MQRTEGPMTEADFLQAILDNPDDEGTRLAYPHWLFEQGDPAAPPRGKSTQVKTQTARRTEGEAGPAEWADAVRLPDLKAREQALLTAHGPTWAEPVAKRV